MNYPKPISATTTKNQMYISVPRYNTKIKCNLFSENNIVYDGDTSISTAIKIALVITVGVFIYNKFIKTQPKVKKHINQ